MARHKKTRKPEFARGYLRNGAWLALAAGARMPRTARLRPWLTCSNASWAVSKVDQAPLSRNPTNSQSLLHFCVEYVPIRCCFIRGVTTLRTAASVGSIVVIGYNAGVRNLFCWGSS